GGEGVADRGGDPGGEVEPLAVGELQILPLGDGSVSAGDGLLLGGAFDEGAGAAHQVVAHQAFPVLGFLGLAEGGQGVDLPVHFGGQGRVPAQRLGRDNAQVVVLVDVQPDL